jgi:hypothetical protein
MKKNVITLIMIFALALLSGSAMAQDKFAPFPGGTYSYTLDIDLANQSDATLTATGLTTGSSTISNISPSLTDIASTVTSISFNVTYSNDATGTCKIEFVITDEVSGCSNNIYLDVTMNPLPTLALGISSTTLTCQALNPSPADNEAASLPTVAVTLENTITFTVTPDVEDITAYSYDYTLTIPTNGQTNLTDYTITYAGPGTATQGTGSITVTGATTEVDGVFTITFVTTTGIVDEDITGTLSAATMTDTVNSGSYIATLSPVSTTSKVQAVPGIGSFN